MGELARLTGLTVRTLHHYDRIGLLSPSRRTESGHRLYTEAEIARLQQILSLRQLGLPLEEIGCCLQGGGAAPAGIIQLHLERLREQIRLQQQLCRNLEEIGSRLRARQDVTAEVLINLIGEIAMSEKYTFTEEQMEKIKCQGELLGPEKIRQVEQEWPELIARVRKAMAKGTPPSSPETQQLARRWQELVEMFTGRDPGITATLQRRYQEAPGYVAQYSLDAEIFDYIARALHEA